MHGRIGLLVPFDTSNDRELWRWCPDDASLHITRTAETLTKSAARLLVLPADGG